MGNALVTVAAKAGSKVPGVAWDGARLIVRVRERAHEGKANEAFRKALAEALGIAPSRVTLMRGQQSKDKLFAISDMSHQELHKSLERLRD